MEVLPNISVEKQLALDR